MKVGAKQKAVGNVPGDVAVVRYLIQIPYLHVITQVPSLFFLGAEVGSLGSRRVVAKSARPVAQLDPSTEIRLRRSLGSIVIIIVCRDAEPGWGQRVGESPVIKGRNDGIIGVVWYVEVVVGRLAGDEVVVVEVDALRMAIPGRAQIAIVTVVGDNCACRVEQAVVEGAVLVVPSK